MSACVAEPPVGRHVAGARSKFGEEMEVATKSEGSDDGDERSSEDDADQRIRQRLEACRQGMAQLDALRAKHNKLMQDMRQRLPAIPGADVKSRKKVPAADAQELKQLEETRCESPLSTCVSHRSSVSIDSGCVSITSGDSLLPPGSQPPMSYSAYRKLSMEEKNKGLVVGAPTTSPLLATSRPINDNRIVATVIESTTAMRTPRYVKRTPLFGQHNSNRPRSLYAAAFSSIPDHLDCDSYSDGEESSESSDGYAVIRRTKPKDYGIDMQTFSQITPPPVQRKFGIAAPPPQRSASHAQLSTRQSTVASVAPTRFAVNASPVTPPRGLQSPATQMRPLRTAPQRRQPAGADPVFHASRVFVDRTPPTRRAAMRPKSMIERGNSTETEEEEEDRPHFAQPAIVLSRQPSSNTQSSSDSTSPAETRRFHIVHSALRSKENAPVFKPSLQHYKLDRNSSGDSAPGCWKMTPARKGWHESEGL